VSVRSGSFGSERTPKIWRSPRLGRKTCNPTNDTTKSVAIAAIGIHAGHAGAIRGARSRSGDPDDGASDSLTSDSRIFGHKAGLSQLFRSDVAAAEISSKARICSAQRGQSFA